MDINKQVSATVKPKSKVAPEIVAGHKQDLLASRMSVNLLPPEMLYQRHQSFRLSLINKLSIGALLMMIFLTSAALAIKISQKSELQRSQNDVVMAESKVSELKVVESQFLILKQRLGSINSIMGGDTKRKAIFSLVVLLTPESLQITNASVDRNGYMAVSVYGNSVKAIETLIRDLGDKEKNSNLIATVDLDGLSMDREGTIRFNLKIIPK